MDIEFIDTKTLGTMLGGIKPESIHRSLCIRGHYLGLRPIKLKNNRLLWRLAAVNNVLDESSN